MIRNGKIARLPRVVRDELNRRLDDAEPGQNLVDWLNKLPAVRKVLKELFGGRAINEQNLSEWRTGGFKDWQRYEALKERLELVTERADDLEAMNEEEPLGDRLGRVLLAELFGLLEELLDEATAPGERWSRLQEASRVLKELRREDHQGRRLTVMEERWQWDMDRENEVIEKKLEEAEKKYQEDLLMAPRQQALLALSMGNTPEAHRLARLLTKIRLNISLDGEDLQPSKTRAEEKRKRAAGGKVRRGESGRAQRGVKGVRQQKSENDEMTNTECRMAGVDTGGNQGQSNPVRPDQGGQGPEGNDE